MESGPKEKVGGVKLDVCDIGVQIGWARGRGAGAGWKSWLEIMVRKTECFHGFVTQRGLGNLCEVTNMYQKFCF